MLDFNFVFAILILLTAYPAVSIYNMLCCANGYKMHWSQFLPLFGYLIITLGGWYIWLGLFILYFSLLGVIER